MQYIIYNVYYERLSHELRANACNSEENDWSYENTKFTKGKLCKEALSTY